MKKVRGAMVRSITRGEPANREEITPPVYKVQNKSKVTELTHFSLYKKIVFWEQ